MKETIWLLIHWNELIVARQIFYFQEKKLYQFSFLSKKKKNDISLAQLISKETGLIEAEELCIDAAVVFARESSNFGSIVY